MNKITNFPLEMGAVEALDIKDHKAYENAKEAINEDLREEFAYKELYVE